jgi:hypothetical protein
MTLLGGSVPETVNILLFFVERGNPNNHFGV